MNGWTVYALAVVTSLVGFSYLIRRLGPLSWRLLVILILGFMLLTPAAVPETSNLAPAWLVALFEAVFGSQQLAINALRPLSVGLVAFFAKKATKPTLNGRSAFIASCCEPNTASNKATSQAGARLLVSGTAAGVSNIKPRISITNKRQLNGPSRRIKYENPTKLVTTANA